MVYRVWRPRRGVLVSVLVTVGVVAASLVYVDLRLIPDYRTAFVLDASAPSEASQLGALTEISNAVGAAVQNGANGDAFSLRRFGGACDSPSSTRQLVGSSIGNRADVEKAVGAIKPSGEATLQRGVLAAIDDFSGRYPFRGKRSNRIIVVTSHGSDACIHDQQAVKKTISDRAHAAGLRLDIRFVGYRMPPNQQRSLTDLAAAAGSTSPAFVDNAADLLSTFKTLTIPGASQALPVNIPSASPVPSASPTPATTPTTVHLYNIWFPESAVAGSDRLALAVHAPAGAMKVLLVDNTVSGLRVCQVPAVTNAPVNGPCTSLEYNIEATVDIAAGAALAIVAPQSRPQTLIVGEIAVTYAAIDRSVTMALPTMPPKPGQSACKYGVCHPWIEVSPWRPGPYTATATWTGGGNGTLALQVGACTPQETMDGKACTDPQSDTTKGNQSSPRLQISGQITEQRTAIALMNNEVDGVGGNNAELFVSPIVNITWP